MATYTVTGYDETVENVEILGEVKQVGATVELDEETAAPFVEEGKLVPLDGVSDSQETGEVTGQVEASSAPVETEPTPDTGEAGTEELRVDGAPSDDQPVTA